MKVKQTDIKSVIPYSRNPRKNKQAIAKVAASLTEYGWQQPIVVDSEMVIVVGHTRLLAAQQLGMKKVPVLVADKLSDSQVKAYRIMDNRSGEDADWDLDLLSLELTDLKELDFDLDLTGFDDSFIIGEETEGLTDEDAVPDVPEIPTTVLGDVWILGNHRLMCGDSTSIDAVEKLMDGQKAQLLHADPPYGMGKEKDGVLNDNIYAENLDAFQMNWWTTFRLFADDNASAYIWGNAPDLWRLWYAGGLGSSEKMEIRNEIVWDKKSIPGMKSDLMTQYPEASERCLYFQIGVQFIGNINSEDYPEQWDVVRGYLEKEAASAEISPSDIKSICGVGMYSHWFTKSQYAFIPKKQYEKLQARYLSNFKKNWDALKKDWDTVKGTGRDIINEQLGVCRAFFDNGHDVMRDVWEFSRVVGDERLGHATPKPVDMMERVMNSSVPPGGLCVEPFGGSGSTLIAAEKTGVRCNTMELSPKYCDIIINRWQNFTGKKAVHEDGTEFNGKG